MWTRSYSRIVEGINASQVWKVWTDVNHWHTWQADIEYAKLDGEFKKGSVFLFKPKGGPKIRIELTKVESNSIFVDLTKSLLARMYGSHALIDHGNELEIKTTIRIERPLSFLWRKLVAENVARGMKEQTERLIEKVKNA